MPDKLTDNEIVKAIEKCTIHKKCKNCMFEDESGCARKLLYLAYNLINRLQAENERLKKVSDIRLECLGRSRAKAKAEAYKEFAERVKKTFPKDDFLRSTKRIAEDIDNLLKELIGE